VFAWSSLSFCYRVEHRFGRIIAIGLKLHLPVNRAVRVRADYRWLKADS
jgi:hypothetical protein